MKTNAPLAIWSLILGILAMISCGPVTGIPAIICGHMAKSRIKADPDKFNGDGMALAGLIMGYFSVVVFALLVIVFVIFGIVLLPVFINIFKDMHTGATQPASSLIINMLPYLT